METDQIQGVPAGLTEAPVQGVPSGVTEVPLQKNTQQAIQGVPAGLQEVPLASQSDQSQQPAPLSTLDKIHKGLEQGVVDGFGLTAPNDDPHKLGLMDIVGQTWNNLKRSAIHSYENLGGASDEEMDKAPIYRIDVPLRSAAATLAVPFDMIGTGIDSMATTIENGSKELIEGVKKGDHQAAARGAGKMLSSLSQIAIGMEGSAANDVAGKVGESLEKGAAKPGNSLLRATSQKNFLYGKNPGRVFIDERIKPTLSLEKLQSQIEDAGSNLDKQVRNILTDPAVASKTVDAANVIDGAVQRELQDLAKESGLKDRQAVIDAIKKVRDDVVNVHDSDGNVIGNKQGPRTLIEANEMKKSIGRNTRWTGDPELENYVNSVRKAMYGSLKDAIESQVQQAKPNTSINALNGRYSNVIEASRLLSKRIAQEGTNELGMRRLLARGEWATALGLILHGEPIVGGLLAADRVARSTSGRIVRGQAADAAGKVVQSAARARIPSTIAQGAAVAGSSGAQKWIHVMLGDGRSIEVHPEDLAELQKRDPKATAESSPEDQ